jgi:hypothetical protein
LQETSFIHSYYGFGAEYFKKTRLTLVSASVQSFHVASSEFVLRVTSELWAKTTKMGMVQEEASHASTLP